MGKRFILGENRRYGKLQAKRIQVLEGNLLVTQTVTVILEVPTSPREEINFHNIWGSMTAEPDSTDANAQGNWGLYIIPDGGSVKDLGDASINNEVDNPRIIACGTFSCSNQSPYTIDSIHPLTSRTLQAGDKLALGVSITGLTAGIVSTRVMLCAHTTRK